jgi:acetyl-CoA acetyltransferase family protein
VADGMLRIEAGRADIVAVGGTESMSGIPLLFPDSMKDKMEAMMRARNPVAKAGAAASFRPADLKPVIGLLVGLTDNYCGLNMGETAEVLAREFAVSREDQDAFALESHRRASAAQKSGRLAREITPVPLPPRFGAMAGEDVGIRHEQSLEALGRLRPVFDRHYGTVTAGNSSQITDGAGALILASDRVVGERRLPVLGWVRGYAFAGLDPARMGLGPVYATAKLLERTGVELRDIDLMEMNEAFAAQVLANLSAFASEAFARKHLNRNAAVGEIDRAKLNVNGGAIALGHPVGATGSRLVQTLLYEMSARSASLGLVTLCIGGGQGGSILLERR